MVKKRIYDIDEVFGTARGVPANYVSRYGIDDKFQDSLKRRKHIVLHGSSKQGKTSLRKRNMPADSYVLSNCETHFTLQKIFATILKITGYEIIETGTKEKKDTDKFSLNFKVFKIGSDGESKDEQRYRKLEFDIFNVNDVVEALNSIKFEKIIVIEDFHFLDEQVQKDFANCLKVFYENTNIIFVVIGVWVDPYKFLHFNGDLAGRIENIDVDYWSDEQLVEIIRSGEKMLNIRFHKNFSEILIQNAFGCVSLVMEFCSLYCKKNGISKTQTELVHLDKEVNFYELIKEVIEFRETRFNSVLAKMAYYGGTDTLGISYVMVMAILISRPEDLKGGISVTQLLELYRKIKPEKKVVKKKMVELLCTLKQWQLQNNIRPSLIEYNEDTTRIYIIDKLFFLWIAHNSISDLLNYSEADEKTKMKVKLILASR